MREGLSPGRRRVSAVAFVILSAATLMWFVFFTRHQAELLRHDARVFAQLRAISIAATDGNLTPEESNSVWNRGAAYILAEMNRLQIPVVITDTTGRPTSAAFLPGGFAYDADGAPNDSALRAYAEELDARWPPFRVSEQEVHFGEPAFISRQQWIPWAQVALLALIIAGGAAFLVFFFRGERELVWTAMARESAHQMGTPLSSLVGWVDMLGGGGNEHPSAVADRDSAVEEIVAAMAVDIERLRKVTRRFELIGRATEKQPVSLRDTLEWLHRYYEPRGPTLGSAGKVSITSELPKRAPLVLGNPTLLEWAFENLIRNAMDALSPGGGEITVSYLGTSAGRAAFRVSDTGPGVPPNIRDRVFDVGVTGKEGGWGVGLSLTRRIFEAMHGGRIELEESARGASFRIELPVLDSAEA